MRMPSYFMAPPQVVPDEWDELEDEPEVPSGGPD